MLLLPSTCTSLPLPFCFSARWFSRSRSRSLFGSPHMYPLTAAFLFPSHVPPSLPLSVFSLIFNIFSLSCARSVSLSLARALSRSLSFCLAVLPCRIRSDISPPRYVLAKRQPTANVHLICNAHTVWYYTFVFGSPGIFRQHQTAGCPPFLGFASGCGRPHPAAASSCQPCTRSGRRVLRRGTGGRGTR